ncbi:unnamed protein product [Parascedosporium putredinis]|uniref:Uncharacterized protein n=1 Tax=Parascedosporium putredinis TaxID=1442378 RepID=A0A9P1HD84_9PEZI|nr:unnamed protein product [Parascedosporium putredinis]CAI8003825.1 unnamed protein product [Parascedosporium putredinis]
MTSDHSTMLEVEAGNKTGVYYITVSNLPFSAQWKDLKDYVRTVCEVDHVEVFSASTHAWVKVIGYEQYRRAFGENEKERISIRTQADSGKSESGFLGTAEELVTDSLNMAVPVPGPGISSSGTYSTSEEGQGHYSHYYVFFVQGSITSYAGDRQRVK